MLTSIELDNYRGFSHFRLNGLRRVTLLVGENNTGKTSVLEAAKILAYGTSPHSLIQIMSRRGERFPPLEADQKAAMDVAHFFHGHTSEIGAKFSIRGNTAGIFGIDVSVIGYEPSQDGLFDDVYPLLPDWEESSLSFSRALRLQGFNSDTSRVVPLNQEAGLSTEAARRAATTGASSSMPVPHLFIPTTGLTTLTLATLWNNALVEAKEKEIVEALRIIEPSLKDLQYLSSERPSTIQRTSGSNFFAGLEGVASRVPFGSLGDGMQRLLALALAIRRARGGYLLVDDIDTGLHYTTLPKMWRLIVETALRLNVQVIATTHSGDCVRSLALLHEEAPELANDVALHRIEKGFVASTPFSAGELSVGARQHMEFR